MHKTTSPPGHYARVLFSAMLWSLLLIPYSAIAQTNISINNDSFCFEAGQPFTPQDNVLFNDSIPPGLSVFVIGGDGIPCLQLLENGSFMWTTNTPEDCCGTYITEYVVMHQGQPLGTGVVEVEIKCPEPDCMLIDLDPFLHPSDPAGGGEPGSSCVHVCEHSETTVFVSWDPNSTYVWSVSAGHTGVVGNDPAQYIITWGAQGTGFIFLQITDAGGNTTSHVICVNILPAPVAFFTSDAYSCLGQPMCFDGTGSLNATGHQWDFGDGNFGMGTNPCHTYLAPGNYTVTLTVTAENYGPNGQILCSCTDTYSMEVEVDELPGPDIYCISTLCEGDSATYTTDATNCSSYIWTVLDANGVDITAGIIGQGTPTIDVTWVLGPIGTIMLEVTGCDSTYCDEPTVVYVPIIASVSQIQGPILVCANSTEVYSLPKWLGTIYAWSVSGGVLTGSGTSNIEPIQWGAPGTGQITVNYYNPFLQGLPGHDETDCAGTATLDVTILPSYTVTNSGPAQVCVGATSVIDATALPDPSYNWSISPAAPFSGQGTAQITVNWTAAGSYVITAQPNNPSSYCNSTQSVVVIVHDPPPALGITGPTQVCPGQLEYYAVQPNGTGYGYQWSATNGVLTATSGTTVGVTWGPGGGNISVQQVMTGQPFCASAPFILNVLEKGPLTPFTISPGSACTNSLITYSMSITPHPESLVTWSLSDPTKGSIVNTATPGQADIQWGDDPGNLDVIVTMELCGASITVNHSLTLIAAIVPTITQVGIFCPGVTSATLNAPGGFSNYSWSTGSLINTTSIPAPGTYSLTTVDANGCSATVHHTAVASPGPISLISSPDAPIICQQSPHNVTMFAQTNANYTLTWNCSFNGGSPFIVLGPGTGASYTHTYQGVLGIYAYTLNIFDNSTGCSGSWGTFIVQESDCPPDTGEVCVPEAHFVTASQAIVTPYCDQISFNFTSSGNFTFQSWSFGDGNTSVNPAPTHTYTSIGYYTAAVCGLVPEQDVPGGTCPVCRTVGVVVPLVADFAFSTSACGVYDLTDLSTFLAGAGNNITAHAWSSSAGHVSNLPSPSFTFPPGAHTITLTVTNANGCQSTITKPINVGGVGIPVISPPASTYCVNTPINFSATATGGTSYNWNFGDGGTFAGQNVTWSYNTPSYPGTYTVTVDVTDALGCQNSASQVVTIYPKPVGAGITGNLVICQGDQTTLTANVAPGGGDGPYTFLWSPNGESTQNITAGGGTYSAAITNTFGCSIQLDSVEVVELPLPLANITGALFICGSGCTMLSVSYVSGNLYQWKDQDGNDIPGQTGSMIQVCSWDMLGGYSVVVTDLNGCSSTSGTVVVQVATPPSFTIVIAPMPACAGQPTQLDVTPVDPNVSYVWNTGDTGPTITVNMAGTYTVVGTDQTSGCSSSASATVEPLPDFCPIPAGCYEICENTMFCAPDTSLTYQWNLNGVPILGATNPCIVFATAGTYSLTATTPAGCTDTSADLVLEVVPCDSTACDQIQLEYSHPINENDIPDECCVVVSYDISYGPIKGMTIYTNDADLVFSNLDPALITQSVTSNSVSLASAMLGGQIPQGVLSNFITLCVQNAINSPQVIVIDWYDFEDEVICSDTIVLHCAVEPDCLYLTEGEVTCVDQEVLFTFTVCNPATSTHSIGHINIVTPTPAGIIITPPAIDLSGNPLLPGQCITLTVNLSGAGIEGQEFCFNLVAHVNDPEEFPGAICCSLDTLYCFDIPICDPCPLVGIEGWAPSESEADCCFNIMLYNNFGPGYFDMIGVSVISPQTTFTINNPFGSGWLTANYTPVSLELVPDPIGTGVPGGTFNLPLICLQTNVPPWQQLEILWMKDGVVICRDTLEVFCEPPCGYFPETSVICDPSTGNWNFQGQIKNMSSQTVHQAHIQFISPSGLGIYDQTVSLGAVPPGMISAPFGLTIGAPALPGDTVCMLITLHHMNGDGTLLECCVFEQCIVLPECEQEEVCECGPVFVSQVMAGFTVTPVPVMPFQYSFTMNSSGFLDCDQFIWTWGHSSPAIITNGPATVLHTFPGPGTFQVCVRVRRTQPDGTWCIQAFCIQFQVTDGLQDPPGSMVLYPNPNNGEFFMKLYADMSYPVRFSLCDHTGRVLSEVEELQRPTNGVVRFDLGEASPGSYLLFFSVGEENYVRKVVKH